MAYPVRCRGASFTHTGPWFNGVWPFGSDTPYEPKQNSWAVYYNNSYGTGSNLLDLTLVGGSEFGGGWAALADGVVNWNVTVAGDAEPGAYLFVDFANDTGAGECRYTWFLIPVPVARFSYLVTSIDVERIEPTTGTDPVYYQISNLSAQFYNASYVNRDTSVPPGPYLDGNPAPRITSQIWNFGDGIMSSEESPSHDYADQAIGPYFDDETEPYPRVIPLILKHVTLTVRLNYGCENTTEQDIETEYTLTEPEFAIMGSCMDAAGHTFVARNDGQNVIVEAFPAGLASRQVRSTLAGAKNPSLWRDKSNNLYLLRADRATGNATKTKSRDSGRTWS